MKSNHGRISGHKDAGIDLLSIGDILGAHITFASSSGMSVVFITADSSDPCRERRLTQVPKLLTGIRCRDAKLFEPFNLDARELS